MLIKKFGKDRNTTRRTEGVRLNVRNKILSGNYFSFAEREVIPHLKLFITLLSMGVTSLLKDIHQLKW